MFLYFDINFCLKRAGGLAYGLAALVFVHVELGSRLEAAAFGTNEIPDGHHGR